jgi:S-adenosylmethionine hydrolase
MSEPLLTLTTDFGPGSVYVAALKGVLLGVNPRLRPVDLSHHIPPQDLRYTSFFLQAAVPYFPPGTLHVIVVDPGVGTERAILYVEVADQRLLVPDNGCWTALCGAGGQPDRVLRVTERRYWRPQVSATFHGRDIFAPVAGHLSLGLDPAQLGPAADNWVRLERPAPVLEETRLAGEVVFIDPFGNLLTNVPGEAFLRWGDRPVRVLVAAREVSRRVRTYGEAEPGALVALVSSMGTLEVAVSHGSAAALLGAAVGTPVEVRALADAGAAG